MNLQALLNTDMETVWRWVRLGLAWWGRELVELLPASLRRGPARSTRWTATLEADGAARLWRDGVPVERLDRPGGALRRADLVLPAGAALVRELDLPRLSGGDLRRLIELNLDRYTPFSPEQVYFDAAVVERSEEGGRQRVRLGVIFRDRARALVAYAQELGLKVERMGPPLPEAELSPGLDFMRAIREQEGGDPRGRRRAWLWSACAALAAACVLVAVLRDMADVRGLQAAVDAQQPMVDLAMRLRGGVEAERARRLALLTRRSVHEPLRILDATTRTLPAGAWAQRLEWNGRSLRLVGQRDAGFDIQGAFHGPALVNARSLLADMTTPAGPGKAAYDVIASAPTGRSR